jgi:hypothetical protein
MAPVTVSLFVSIRVIRGFLRKKVPGTFFLDKNLSNGASHRFPIRVHSWYSWFFT